MPETTFTPESAGLENKNVVYEYQLVANNNIKDILMAVMEKNDENAVNITGYSVMELLVENLLVFHGITGEALTAFRGTTFANDAEKIAWIIRAIATPDGGMDTPKKMSHDY